MQDPFAGKLPAKVILKKWSPPDADLLDHRRPVAGRGYLKLVQRLRSEGWRVELIYLALPSMEMSKMRVAERVAHGGHNIPVADIERRFARSLANLLDVFSGEADACRCFMNSGPVPELVFEQQVKLRNIVHAGHYRHLQKEATS